MEKTTHRFQRIATILADLNAEGVNAQTVNDLLTMYVGAASQHVLRMSFVPEQEAHKLRKAGHDILVPSHSIATTPLHYSFHPSNLGDLGWPQQSSDTQQPHGALGNRSFPH